MKKIIFVLGLFVSCMAYGQDLDTVGAGETWGEIKIKYNAGVNQANFIYDTIWQVDATDSVVLVVYPDNTVNALPLEQFDTANVVQYYYFEQAARPTQSELPEGKIGFWYDTDAYTMELLFNKEVAGADSLYSVSMTNVTP
jgi:hypothetical protein